jgi:hypothetical protein
VLYEYALSGKELAVSSATGAISPESWGGPRGAYVTGYLPTSSDTLIDTLFGPVGVALLRADGKLAHPLQISGGGTGCRLAYPVFVPHSDQLLAIRDCDIRVASDVAWATSTDFVSIDLTTGRVEGVVTNLPPGLDIDRPVFDSNGEWMAFSASAAGPQLTEAGVFIYHDGQFWQVPRSETLDDIIWQ